MKREERLQAIGCLEESTTVALADRALTSMDVEIIRGPLVGLLMLRAEEPSEKLAFNFCEVTVTEAEVEARGVRGYAIVLGRSLEKAVAGAVIDVALEIGHEMSDEITVNLREARLAEEKRWGQRWLEVAPTVVKFEDVT